MKIEQKGFTPVVISLESLEEVNIIYELLQVTDDDEQIAIRSDVPTDTVTQLLDDLSSGIRATG